MYLFSSSLSENTDTYKGLNGKDWSVFDWSNLNGGFKRFNGKLYLIKYYNTYIEISKFINGNKSNTIKTPEYFALEFIYNDYIYGFINPDDRSERKVCFSNDFGLNWYIIENRPFKDSVNPNTLETDRIVSVVGNSNYLFVETSITLYRIPINFLN